MCGPQAPGIRIRVRRASSKKYANNDESSWRATGYACNVIEFSANDGIDDST